MSKLLLLSLVSPLYVTNRTPRTMFWTKCYLEKGFEKRIILQTAYDYAPVALDTLCP